MSNTKKISHEEYKARTRRVQASLNALGCGALLVTSEDNVQYLTGYKSPVWNNLTRPRYLIVPADGEPFLISSANYAVIIETTTWITDIRTWVSPNPEDDGVSLVIDGLKSSLNGTRKIAAELGPQSRIAIPVGDFIRIKAALRDVEFIDAHSLLMSYRIIKSQTEIERIQIAATATSDALHSLPETAHAGQTLYELGQALKVRIIQLGAEDVPYMIGVSGRGGYPCVNLAPDDRPLQTGDVLVFDVAARYDGYYCDFDRNYAVGKPTTEVQSQHRRLWDATAAGLEAIKPGLRMSDIWTVMANILGVKHVRSTGIGRMGHSIGLRMCEEPSINEADHTVIEENMVLTLEPAVVLKPATNRTQSEKRMLVHEENLVVTATGARLISTRTPQEMPVIA